MTESLAETRIRPDLETAESAIAAGMEQERLITVFGRCTVDYEGRASSTLGPGDRLLVLKPDGTALVHTDEGQQPVNWQPPGCAHSVTVTDDTLVIESLRTNPDERLEVHFEEVVQCCAFAATDEEELSLSGTEDDLRERILADPSLVEEGFEPRATERETPAGSVDIFGVDADGNSVVVELKRRRVGPDAASQLNRYVDALERELHSKSTVRGILVAPSITDRTARLLAERDLEFVSLSPETRSGK